MKRIALALVALFALSIAVVYWMGSGAAGDFWEEGEAVATPRPAADVAAGDAAQSEAAQDVGIARPKQSSAPS